MTMPIDAFINPFLKCVVCAAQVSWHTGDLVTNHPCGHKGVYTTCLTWSPANGCICKERFGAMNHAGPSAGVRPIAAALPGATTTAASPSTVTSAAKP